MTADLVDADVVAIEHLLWAREQGCSPAAALGRRPVRLRHPLAPAAPAGSPNRQRWSDPVRKAEKPRSQSQPGSCPLLIADL
jgi:hypothetical protein